MSLYVDHLLKQQDAMVAMLRAMVEMETPSADKQAAADHRHRKCEGADLYRPPGGSMRKTLWTSVL